MRKFVKTFVMALAITIGLTAQVLAAGLVEYKASGDIGEMPNGLVGTVTMSAAADVQRVVDQINTERLDRYEDIASKNNLSLAKVQALAGEKLISQTPNGQYYQLPSGDWIKK